MNNSKNTLGKYPWLEQLSTQALEDLLRQDFAAGEGHSDPDFVAAILEVIAQRTPDEALPVDTDTAWASLRARTLDKPHDPAPTEEDPKVVPFPDPKPPRQEPPAKSRRPRRPWVVAAVVCLLVVILVIPAYGSGKLQEWIQWDNDTFSFRSSENEALFSSPEYQALEAFVSAHTDLPVLPTWYPDGTVLSELETLSLSDGESVTALFSYHGTSFTLTLTLYNTIPESRDNVYEKNIGSPEECYINHIPHYFYDNMNRTGAAWWNQNVECAIQGEIAMDTLKQMVSSIYE